MFNQNFKIKEVKKCEHKRRRNECVECGGSSICEHSRRRTYCKECNFNYCLINLQRVNLRRLLKQINKEKSKTYVEYLGCDIIFFKDFIQKKMTECMNWDNIHLDHIKPVSSFDLSNYDEFLDCCHYSNFQLLIAKDNLEKGSVWNTQDNIFWIENIKGKDYINIYLPC